MLRIDFRQRFEDHCGILILVKPVGYIGGKRFENVLSEVAAYTRAQVPNSTRTLHLRYSKRISPAYIDWSNFHAHRKVLGLICVAKCSDVAEIDKLEPKISELQTQFGTTLVDSRCFVLGCTAANETEGPKEFVLLDEEDFSEELQRHLAEFVASLFNVLESKRLTKLSDKAEKASHIFAPVEYDPNGIEFDSRSSKRRSLGRSRKYAGDMCLLTGLPQDALCHYSIAVEHLRSVNDSLWLAGALEGQCAAAVILNSNDVDSEHKSLVLPTDCAAKTSGITTNGPGSDVDELRFKNAQALTHEEIRERFSEALRNYSRVKVAAVVETEAYLKFTRYLTSQKRCIEAGLAIQNMLAVNIQLNDQEKIQRYSTIALLYSELGFERKASFFSRIAAMQCVSQTLPQQSWPLSYNFLRGALEGYKISLNPEEFPTGHSTGWPVLQIRILNELVFTARRLGDPSLAVTHMALLLHSMHDHLTDDEKMEMADLLESFAKQCSGSIPATHNQLAHADDRDIPPVPLTRMPLIRGFSVRALAPHLRPSRIKALANKTTSPGPFIFSSLRKLPSEVKRINVLWVDGELGEVSMDVHNPFPFELKVSKMVLQTEGVDFEPFPAQLSLPPHTGPHQVILLGTPHGVGELRITGYTVHVFGTESTCALKQDNLENRMNFPVSVDVVPSMPLLHVSTSLPKVRSQATDPDTPQLGPLVTAVTLYAGQSMKGSITLENVGRIPIESLLISLSTVDGEGADHLFSFDQEEVNSKIPLAPGKSTDISVTISGLYHVPSGIGSSENLTYDPEAPWGLTGVVRFSYSGGGGGGGGGETKLRQASISIDVTVVPSLHCDHFQIQTHPSDRLHCLLLFDAVNQTSNDMELCYTVHKTDGDDRADTLSIKANDRKRVVLQLPRFILPAPDLADERVSKKDSTRKSEYSKAVRDMISLHWSLPACQASGSGNIQQLSMDSAMLEALKREPISFALTVNGQVCEEDVSVSLCSCAELSVRVTNHSDVFHGPFLLVLEPYQDHANGSQPRQLNGMVAWVGTLHCWMPKLSPGESFEHSCSLLFFYHGQFCLGVSCSECKLEDSEAGTTSPRQSEECRRVSRSECKTKGSEASLRQSVEHKSLRRSECKTKDSEAETSSLRQSEECKMGRRWTMRPPLTINVTS